jgi:hypothetical protein
LLNFEVCGGVLPHFFDGNAQIRCKDCKAGKVQDRRGADPEQKGEQIVAICNWLEYRKFFK